jgi:iron uptake system EfeUOB component EfeO/EfeM
MQINSVSSHSFQPSGMAEMFNKTKQSFDSIGSALESGDLSSAKTALTEFQKYAPPNSGNQGNPMDKQMNSLASAIESGDLSSAKSAYSDIKTAMSNHPAGPPPEAMDFSSMSAINGNSSGVLNTTA